MPPKRLWTTPKDAHLKLLRQQGRSWDAIAIALEISRNAAIERGRRLGARLPPRLARPAMDDPDRPALPPGHPISWGAMNADTLLAGEPYPDRYAFGCLAFPLMRGPR